MAKKRRSKDYAPTIDAELDLHGYFVREVEPALRAFFLDAQERGHARVRIVVGKGVHSQEGPVLPDVVKAYLNRAGYSYTYAKVYEGGEGALVVRL
jgi:DNA-nicking Smr family endonuclease